VGFGGVGGDGRGRWLLIAPAGARTLISCLQRVSRQWQGRRIDRLPSLDPLPPSFALQPKALSLFPHPTKQPCFPPQPGSSTYTRQSAPTLNQPLTAPNRFESHPTPPRCWMQITTDWRTSKIEFWSLLRSAD